MLRNKLHSLKVVICFDVENLHFKLEFQRPTQSSLLIINLFSDSNRIYGMPHASMGPEEHNMQMLHFHLFFTLKYIKHLKHFKHLSFGRNLCGRLECLMTNADVQLRISVQWI